MIHDKALSDSSTSMIKRHQTAKMMRGKEECQAQYMPVAGKQEMSEQRLNIPQDITGKISTQAGMIHDKELSSNVATSTIKRHPTAKMTQPHQTVKMRNLKTNGSAQYVPAAISKELPVQSLHFPQFTSSMWPSLPPEQWCGPLPEVL